MQEDAFIEAFRAYETHHAATNSVESMSEMVGYYYNPKWLSSINDGISQYFERLSFRMGGRDNVSVLDWSTHDQSFSDEFKTGKYLSYLIARDAQFYKNVLHNDFQDFFYRATLVVPPSLHFDVKFNSDKETILVPFGVKQLSEFSAHAEIISNVYKEMINRSGFLDKSLFTEAGLHFGTLKISLLKQALDETQFPDPRSFVKWLLVESNCDTGLKLQCLSLLFNCLRNGIVTRTLSVPRLLPTMEELLPKSMAIAGQFAGTMQILFFILHELAHMHYDSEHLLRLRNRAVPMLESIGITDSNHIEEHLADLGAFLFIQERFRPVLLEGAAFFFALFHIYFGITDSGKGTHPTPADRSNVVRKWYGLPSNTSDGGTASMDNYLERYRDPLFGISCAAEREIDLFWSVGTQMSKHIEKCMAGSSTAI